MSKHLVQKTVACFISISLFLPDFVFAADASSIKSQTEIKKLLSATVIKGRSVKNSDLILLSLLSAAAAGAGGFYAGNLWQKGNIAAAKDMIIKQLDEKISLLNQALKVAEKEEARMLRILNEQSRLFSSVVKFNNDVPVKDLRKAELLGFNRGYDAAFRGSEELSEVFYSKGFRAGYGQKATEEFVSGKVVAFRKSGKMSKIEAEALINSLKKELSDVEGKLGSIKALAETDKHILSLMSRANKNLMLLETAVPAQDVSVKEREIISAAQELKTIPASGVKKELLENFSESVLRAMKRRGGMISLSSVALFSASIVFMSKNNYIAEISHKRLQAARTLKSAYDKNPELFAAHTFILKEEYGIDMVSSVLCEHQQYLPLLEAQLSVISSEQLISMLDSLKGSRDPHQAKQLLLESLSAG